MRILNKVYYAFIELLYLNARERLYSEIMHCLIWIFGICVHHRHCLWIPTMQTNKQLFHYKYATNGYTNFNSYFKGKTV